MNDVKPYKITGGPETNSVKVFAPDGREVTSIMSITINRMRPGGFVTAHIEVAATLDIEANTTIDGLDEGLGS